MRTARLCSFSCLFAGLMLATRLYAQEPPAVLPPPPPPPPGEAPIAPLPPAPLVAPEAPEPPALMQTPTACVPACRAGFTCLQGHCVSSCNPPCGNGEECTAAGECARAATLSVTGEPTQDGVHRHDGFFLRLTLGGGGGGVGVDLHEDNVDRGFGGGGFAGSVDVGGSNGDNLAIFGRLRFALLTNPVVSIDGSKISDADASPVSQEMLGVGIAYFLMPLNLYLGAAAGLAVIGGRFDRNGQEEKFNGGIGFGFDVEIGKEWWIADDWGLGGAIRGSFATAGGGDDLPKDTQLGAIFVAALLSVTYQ